MAVTNAGTKVPDYRLAFERIRIDKPDAIFVSHASRNYGFREQIGNFTRTSGVPSTCP